MHIYVFIGQGQYIATQLQAKCCGPIKDFFSKDQINQFINSLRWHRLCSRPYQVSVVGGAGALLSDPHAETGKAAVFAVLAEMEGARLAAGARRTLHIHLQRHIQSITSSFFLFCSTEKNFEPSS